MTKLVSVIDMPVVLLTCNSIEGFTDPGHKSIVKKVFDTRLSHFLYNNQCQNPLFYLFTNSADLYYLGRNVPIQYSTNLSESKFMTKSVKIEDKCLIQCLCQLFDLEQQQHICTVLCPKDLLSLCYNSNHVFSKMLNSPFPIALTTHVSTDIWTRPYPQLFVTLGVLENSLAEKIRWNDVKFVSVTFDGLIYALAPAQAQQILKQQNQALKQYKIKNETGSFDEELSSLPQNQNVTLSKKNLQKSETYKKKC